MFAVSADPKGSTGLDQVAQGMGGLMSVTGHPGDGPVRAGVAITDLTSGMFLAIGILAALHERDRSGEGQWVKTSLLEAMICDLPILAYASTAVPFTLDGMIFVAGAALLWAAMYGVRGIGPRSRCNAESSRS